MKEALLVGCSDYKNTKFRKPPAAWDIDALEGVLRDPAIGGFQVHKLLDRPSSEISQRIESFFKDRKPRDLLLYLSCHGVLVKHGPEEEVQRSTGALVWASCSRRVAASSGAS
jgi:hypothetical protein